MVLVDGELVLYVERGGRTLLSWTDEPVLLQPAVDALALAVREGGSAGSRWSAPTASPCTRPPPSPTPWRRPASTPPPAVCALRA